MGKGKKFLKSAWGGLSISLLGCLLMSWGAQMVNTSGYSVDVKKVTADMDTLYSETYADAKIKPFRLGIGENKDGMVNAKLAMNVYLPKGVSENNPAPAVVMTHGYLNSKEFLAGQAIELARRGYVVFDYDQYDHGDSTWDTPSQFNFYVWSAYDAIEYAYAQPYVLKDAKGNGMIGATGHSMGGFSSEIAVAWDTFNKAMGVYSFQKVNAMLAQGADFRYVDPYVAGYSKALGLNYSSTFQTYGDRSCGTLSGRYDEFFFNNTATDKNGTVVEKDYPSDPMGYGLLGLNSAGKANTFYKTDSSAVYADGKWDKVSAEEDGTETVSEAYGQRVIYKVAGDHPYNTWSPEAAGDVVDFFNHSFEHQLAMAGLGKLSDHGVNPKSGATQTWWLKEVFTCLGLFFLVGAAIFLMNGLVSLPFFRHAVSKPVEAEEAPSGAAPAPQAEEKEMAAPAEGEAKPIESPQPVASEVKPAEKKPSGIARCLSVCGTIVSLLIGAFMIPYLLDREGIGVDFAHGFGKWMLASAFVLLFAGIIIAFVLNLTKGKEWLSEHKAQFYGPLGILMTISLSSLLLMWLTGNGNSFFLNRTNRYWNAPTQGGILYWALVSSLVSLIFALLQQLFFKREEKAVESFGLRASWKNVGVSALIAMIGATLVYLVTLISTKAFGVDFRVYTYAIRCINAPQFVAGLRYLPFYLLFTFMAGICVSQATRKVKGLKGDFLAAAIEVIPMCLFLLLDYGKLLATGTAMWPTSALNAILVQGFFFTLFFLGFVQHRTEEKTGNAWLGIFFNGLFITFVTLANTTVYNLH